ncbi:hypothetical protein FKM82_030337 [Ascaphus truei]
MPVSLYFCSAHLFCQPGLIMHRHLWITLLMEATGVQRYSASLYSAVFIFPIKQCPLLLLDTFLLFVPLARSLCRKVCMCVCVCVCVYVCVQHPEGDAG